MDKLRQPFCSSSFFLNNIFAEKMYGFRGIPIRIMRVVVLLNITALLQFSADYNVYCNVVQDLGIVDHYLDPHHHKAPFLIEIIKFSTFNPNHGWFSYTWWKEMEASSSPEHSHLLCKGSITEWLPSGFTCFDTVALLMLM